MCKNVACAQGLTVLVPKQQSQLVSVKLTMLNDMQAIQHFLFVK